MIYLDDKTVTKIKEKYYFPKIKRFVKYQIHCCPECLLYKLPKGKVSDELHLVTLGRRPLNDFYVNHTGHL